MSDGDLVTLDGSGSFDDGGSLTYAWSQTAGPSVALSSTVAVSPTFTAPTSANDDETLTFSLTVNDGSQDSGPDTVTVTVRKRYLQLSADALRMAEGGSATYTVRLATLPDVATVTVALVATGSDDVTLDATSLTFSQSTWSTPQTVTVTASEDDSDVTNDTATITHTASGGAFQGIAVDLLVTVEDNDASPDVNEDGEIDRDDALVLFYVYDFGPDLKDSAILRDAALRPRKGALAENDASYLRMITNAESWATAAPTGSDLNASGSVDRDDALVMFYVYDFGPDLKDSAILREAALRPRKGALEENDASYLQMITNAERLAGATP